MNLRLILSLITILHFGSIVSAQSDVQANEKQNEVLKTTDNKEEKKDNQQKNPLRQSVFLSLGAAGIFNEIHTAWDKEKIEDFGTWKGGYSWMGPKIHKSFLGPLQLGVGFTYYGFHTSGYEDFIYDELFYINNPSFMWHYMAPQFILKFMTKSNFLAFQLNAGLGLSISDYKDLDVVNWRKRHNTIVGDGYNISFGIEINIIREFGLICNISFLEGRVNQTFCNYQNPELPNIRRVGYCGVSSLDFGFVFHF